MVRRKLLMSPATTHKVVVAVGHNSRFRRENYLFVISVKVPLVFVPMGDGDYINCNMLSIITYFDLSFLVSLRISSISSPLWQRETSILVEYEPLGSLSYCFE